jgi:NAD(P)-dependent dehydrogenase (short-subunit alcohol dehydrogenase family)
MDDLRGRHALVTGAARGIGAAIALEFAERGADVTITYQHSEERAAALVRAIEAKGRRGFAIRADSADAHAVRRSVDEAASMMGGLDVLVNNAGVLVHGPVSDMGLDDIDRTLAVNVRAVVVASQAAMPYLPEGGRIISIGSCLAERVGIDGVALYAMSKSALLAFTRALARELGPRDVTVNLVHPGPIATDMSPSEGRLADVMRSQMALGRFGEVGDVAAAVAFLASPAARHVTGTGLVIDGGMNA